MVDFIHNTFNSGEISPLLFSRFDLQKYFNACEELENFVVLPQGGIARRPGTYFVEEVKDSSKAVRLIPFVFSSEQAYVLEFGDLYIRFYTDHAQVESGGSAVEVVSPYGEDDLAELKFQGSADVLYITHPDYPVYKLARTSATVFTLTEVVFSRGPFKKENDTETTITPTVAANNWAANTAYSKNTCVLSGNNIFTCQNNHTSNNFANDYNAGQWKDGITANVAIQLVASNNVFNNNHVNSYWQISHKIDMGHYGGTIAKSNGAIQTSNSFPVKGNWECKTHRTWAGTFSIQRSYDNGSTWNNYYDYYSKDDTNILATGKEIEDDVLYRVRIAFDEDDMMAWEFNVLSYINNGVAKITACNNATTCNASVVNTIHSNNSTKYWSEGAWSNDEGFPSGVCFHEERLSFGGTDGQPTTVWLSKASDFENMEVTSEDDSALIFTLATGNQDKITWLISHIESLVLGTAGGVWKIGCLDSDKALSATNAATRRQTTDGCYSDTMPSVVNNTVLYLQRAGKELKDLTYKFDITGYETTSLSLLFEHIAKEGIIDMAFQAVPYKILWCVTGDGNLFGVTYEVEQKILAAHRHPTDGTVESIAVIPGDDQDELWLLVNRTNGRMIEYLKPFEWDDIRDAYFVDCGLTYDGGAEKTITAISKATECTVTSAAHGLTDGDKVRFSIASGMTELDNEVYTVSDAATDTFKIKDETGTAYVDSTNFTTFTAGTCEKVAKTFSGLTQLASETVDLLADGSVIEDVSVDGSGAFATDEYYNTVHAGLPFTSLVKPVKFETAMSSGIGVAQVSSKKRRIHELILSLYETVGGKAGETEATVETMIYKEVTDTETPVQPYTGDKRIMFKGHYNTGGAFYVVQDQPLPMTIRSITGRMGVYD